MAKDLPYFKFNVSEYINGNITLEDFYVQGVFINVCAFYWFKSGKVTITEIKRRLSKAKPSAFQTLIDSNLIKVDGENLVISFLNEQLNERGFISIKNSENGKLGGRGHKSETKATALNIETKTQSEVKAKQSNIEERREEEKREREEEITSAADDVSVWPCFTNFWYVYNKKISKSKCEKKWKKITQGAREKIMQHLQEYIPSTPNPKYRKNPSTYLENESWNDEIINLNEHGQPRITAQGTLDRLNSYTN